MGAQLDRMAEAEEKRRREGRTVIDRTSSMTVGQVERFWRVATAEAFRSLLEAMPPFAMATPSKRDILKSVEERLDAIAEDALEKVVGR